MTPTLRELAGLAPRPPAVELLWPRTGLVGPHHFPEKGWPAGAFFWRPAGAAGWRPIPGRSWDAEKREGRVDAPKRAAAAADDMRGPYSLGA